MEWSHTIRTHCILSFDQRVTQNKVGEVMTFLRRRRRDGSRRSLNGSRGAIAPAVLRAPNHDDAPH